MRASCGFTRACWLGKTRVTSKSKKSTHPWKRLGWLSEQDMARAEKRDKAEQPKFKKRKG